MAANNKPSQTNLKAGYKVNHSTVLTFLYKNSSVFLFFAFSRFDIETKEEKRKTSKDKSIEKPKTAAATKAPKQDFTINPVPPQLGFSNPATFWPEHQTMSAEFYQVLPVDQSTATNDKVSQQKVVFGSSAASDYSIHRLTSNSTAASASSAGTQKMNLNYP